MEYFFYAFGMIIGIALFLYLLSFYEFGKQKIKNVSNKKKDKSGKQSQKIVFQDINIHPGGRICPVCGSTLTKFETLYASQGIMMGKEKIFIHGCKYCYKAGKGGVAKKV